MLCNTVTWCSRIFLITTHLLAKHTLNHGLYRQCSMTNQTKPNQTEPSIVFRSIRIGYKELIFLLSSVYLDPVIPNPFMHITASNIHRSNETSACCCQLPHTNPPPYMELRAAVKKRWTLSTAQTVLQKHSIIIHRIWSGLRKRSLEPPPVHPINVDPNFNTYVSKILSPKYLSSRELNYW